MKRIFLLRHGNAAPGGSGKADRDRPLEESGRTQIVSVSDKLVSQNYIPEIIITSSALRAKTSGEIAGKIVHCSMRSSDTLYSAASQDYITLLKGMENRFNSVMIVAHNPTISDFAGRLSGTHIGMGTGNICLLELDIEQWSDLGFNSPVISSTIIRP